MNTVGFTTAEIKARNDRAFQIVASHTAKAQEKQVAADHLKKAGYPHPERAFLYSDETQRVDDPRPVACR